MSPSDRSGETTRAAAAGFATTLWTVVLAAKEGTDTKAGEAMARLCQVYWYPLYAYVRRLGYSPPDAQDLTQEFFSRLLAKDYLENVHREKGKFRSFLLVALKHFLSDQWDKARARKRGGGLRPISLDDGTAEARYIVEPTHELTAEKLYERRWALTLLEQVLSRLEEEFIRADKKELFAALQNCLQAERSMASYRDIAVKLGMTEGAVKVAAHRLRQRYRELLRSEIAQTVASPAGIDEELRHLFAALS